MSWLLLETLSAAISTVAFLNTVLQGSFKGYCLSISPEKEGACLTQNHPSPALSMYPFPLSLQWLIQLNTNTAKFGPS